jgi:hypothetical protein
MHYILECTLDNAEIWGKLKGKRRLLAVVTPCKTEGKDATKVVTEYTAFRATIVTDLQAIQHVIGRAKRRNTWGIIDRSMEEARPVFISGEEGSSERILDENEDGSSENDEFLF